MKKKPPTLTIRSLNLPDPKIAADLLLPLLIKTESPRIQDESINQQQHSNNRNTQETISRWPKARTIEHHISDELWALIKDLIPQKQTRIEERHYSRKPGAGRKPTQPRLIFEGIVFALKTNTPWKQIPSKHFGSTTSLHSHFQTWCKQGFFSALWERGIAQHRNLEGISWKLIRGIVAKTDGEIQEFIQWVPERYHPEQG